MTSSPLQLDRPTWVFGHGSFGRDVAKALERAGVRVLGFVATAPSIATCDDLPVRPVSTIGGSDQIAIGVFSRNNPYDQIARACDGKTVVWPMTFYEQLESSLGWRFWLGAPSAYAGAKDRMTQARGLLADDRSKQLFDRIAAFRQSLDLSYSGYADAENQYFSDLTLPGFKNRPLAYVDCGAFNGDSYQDLVGRHPVGDAWLLEPDVANFKALAETAERLGTSAVCLPLAATETAETLYFSGAGESAAQSANGVPVQGVSLDLLLAGRAVDFIKMDIEGGERAALKGARRTIERHRPTLAISLYHRQSDLWELPLLLDELTTDYRFMIRQHGYNSFDSVLYGVPAERA